MKFSVKSVHSVRLVLRVAVAVAVLVGTRAEAQKVHTLSPTPSTVAWGYYW
jgi:hypothetical protein